ncbi:MAG: hypothetical protein IT373_12500 [Polyangiaceae bacterium]|nr:hypothetical protein [Polyangiaceae bacterium]
MPLPRAVPRVLCACLALGACGRSEPGPKDPPPSVSVRAEPPSPLGSEAASEAPWAGESVLLGVVHEQGTAYCTDRARNDPHFTARFFSAGFVPLLGALDAVRALHGRPAVLFGRPSTRPPAPEIRIPEPHVDCMPIQARSDWVPSPDGILVRRDAGPALAGFEVRAARPFAGLAAKLAGTGVRVAVDTPLAVPLASLALVAHYEGCYGKPGTTSRTVGLGDLAPHGHAEAAVEVFDVEADAPQGRSDHVLASLALHAATEGIYFDLDVPVRALGLDLECPERGRK